MRQQARRASFVFTLLALSLTGCPDDGKLPLGATCTDSEQCESGLCLEGICVDPSGIGDTSPDAGDGEVSDTSDIPDISVVPVAVVTVQPPPVFNGPVARFEFVSEPAGATFECIIDGGQPAPCESPLEVTATEGNHTLTIIARWPDGTVDPNPPTFTWRVDLTAPTTTITAAPPLYDNSIDVTLTFAADESATFECRIDDEPFAACTSPWSITSLADGPHTAEVRATDDAGNLEDPATSHTWTIDTSTPDTTLDTSPSGSLGVNTANLTFSSELTPGATFECSLDAAAFTACVSPVALTDLAEGEHTFEVRAVNLVGVVDPTPAFATWTVDLTAPTVTIVEGPSGFISIAAPTFTFVAEGEPTLIECRLDDEPFADCTSPFTTPPLSDGDHTFEVQVTDAAGNVDGDDRTFIVDTTLPSVAIVAGPFGPTDDNTPTFNFAVALATTIECRIDAEAWAACTSPITTSTLADGDHTFEVRVANAAGTTATESRAFTVDTVDPILTLVSGPSGPTNVNPPIFVFSVDGALVVECRIDAEPFVPCIAEYTPAALTQGAHTFEVRASDAASNLVSAQRAFSIDTVAPTLSLTGGPEAPTNDATPAFTFTAGTDATTVECRIDDAAFVPCTSPYTTATLPDGPHTIDVRVADSLGNQNTVSRSFSVDTVAPTLALTSGPTGPTNTNPPTFEFTAGADATITCRVDAAAFAPCTSPHTTASLAQGNRTFDVRATDAVGNVTTASRSFSIDTVAPTVSVLTGPSGSTNVNPPTFTFTTGVDATLVECRVDTGGFSACTSPHTTASLPQGARTFEVRVSDALGNQATASRSFTVDTVAPTLTFTSGPTGPTNTNPPTFAFSPGADASSIQCRVDAAAFATCTSPYTPASLGQGDHTVEVRATDSVGNSETISRSFSIDTVAPTLTITAGPTGPTNVNPPTFSFTAGADAATVQCRIGAAVFAACTSPYTPASLGQGAQTLEVRAADSLGNQTTASRSFSIDTVAPTITITSGPNGPTNTNPPTFGFTAGADAATVECRVDTGAFAACTSPHTTTSLPQGTRTFEVRVTDAVGNQATTSRAFSIDTVAPTISITSGPNGSTNINPPTFGFSAGADAATIQCRVDTGAFATCTTPYTTASLGDGPHTFDVRVADSLGNQATASRSFTIDTVSPPVSITSGPTGPTNTNPPTFGFTVGGSATTIQCRVDTSPFATCTSPHTTTSLGQGNRTFEVRAADALGNASTASQTFSIDTVAPTVSITSGPSGPTNTNPPSFDFTAGADASSIQCRVGAAAFANCTSPFTTASLGQGNHTFDVRVGDALGNQATASRSFNIDTVAPSILITAGPTGPSNDTTPTFSFSAGADATSVQCRIDTAAFASCLSPYTPAALGQGAHTFDVRVADSLGNQATASRSFSIDTVPPTITITSGPTGPTNVNPPSFSFTAGADATTTQCRIDTAAFAACTSPYVPATLGQGAHTMEVRVADSLGNQATASRSFSIDTVAPTITITSGPSGPTNNNPTAFRFGAGADATTVECRIDTDAYAACTTPFATPVLTQGAHTFDVRVADALGNQASASRSFSTDTVAPTLTITSGPTGPVANDSPSFGFTAGADATSIRCRLDSDSFADCTSPFTTFRLPQGNHTFEVNALDAVGNVAVRTRSFTVDTVGPSISITSGPSGPVRDNSPSFGFTVANDAVTVECRLDQDPYEACTSPFTTFRLSQGGHTFTIRATDALGNQTAASRNFTVDTVGPTVTITQGPNGITTNDNPPSFSFTTGNDTVSRECRVDTGNWAACTSPHTTATLTQGAHTFEIRAADALGNYGVDSAAFTIDTVAPTLSITGGPTGPTNDTTPSFSFNRGADATTVQCRIDTAAFVSCTSPWTPATLAQGNHTFYVRAYDAVGNLASQSRSFSVDTVAPTVTITSGPANGDVFCPERTTVTFAFTVTDASSVTRQCRIYREGTSPLPAYSVCSSPYTGAIVRAGVPWIFDLRVTDAAGNVRTVSRNFWNYCLN